MKQSLSLFICFLILTNCSISLSLSKNNKISQIGNDFPNPYELDTCEDGVLVDIDPKNIFFQRTIIREKANQYYNQNNVWAEIPSYTISFNTGENGKYLARLNLSYFITGVHHSINYYNGSYSHYGIHYAMKLNDKVVDLYYQSIARKTGYTWEDIYLEATVFNIPPGLHTVKIEIRISCPIANNWFPYVYFHEGTKLSSMISYLELEGEFKDYSSTATEVNSFILPTKIPFEKAIWTKMSVNIDDQWIYYYLNDLWTNFYDWYINPANERNNWTLTRTIPVRLFEGDTFYITGYDGGGLRGIRVSVGYFNNLGYPEISNSGTDGSWTCDGLANIANHQANLYSSLEISHNNYQPLDFSSKWIWNGAGSPSYATCRTKLKRNITNSVIYVTAATHLTYVQVGTKKIDSITDNQRSEVVKTFTDAHFGTLKTGQRVTIASSVSNTGQNANTKAYKLWNNFNAVRSQYQGGFISAVIAYKNKAGKVVTITTGMKGWICNDLPAVVYPIEEHYRNEYFLTTTFGARAIHGSNSTTNVCYFDLD